MCALRLLLAVAVGLSLAGGCATAASREQIVSIDSLPRGAEIVRDDGTVVGTTPALVAQPRAQVQDYTVRFADQSRHVVARCEARTAFLIADAIPGLPLLVLPPPLNVIGWVGASAILAGIDTADGAVFECPDAVLVKQQQDDVIDVAADVIDDVDFATLPVERVEGCPRYLVVPPLADSERASQSMTRAIADTLLRTSACATVVDAAEAMAAFGRKKVTWQRALVRDRFHRGHVHDVAFSTRATHLVQLEAVDGDTTDSADNGRVQLRVVDVHTLQAAQGPPFVVPSTTTTEEERDLFREVLLFGVGLIPDTFIWNAAAKFFPFEPLGNERVVDQVFTNPFLATAINFQILHLDNPEAHAPWDYTLTVGPDLLALLNGSRMRLEADDGTTRTLTLNVIQAVLPISPRATFFTPAGVSAVWVGVGPALIIDWDEPGFRADWRLAAFVHAGISHSVFLTRTVFVGVAAHGNRSLQPHVLRDGVRLDWFFQASINLGISFPDLTYDLADWL